jgi:hypothetical protein
LKITNRNLFYGILGTLTSVISAFVAISKKTGTTTVNLQEKERKKLSPTQEKNSSPEQMK